LMTVIFMFDSRNKKLRFEFGDYFLAAGGSSRIQGQSAIVLTLPFVFLMTVIFMSGISR